MRLLAPFVFAALAATAAQAQRPPVRSANQLPMEVRKAVALLNAQCKDAGGMPGKSSDLIKFADLTGDGIGDYIVDVAAYDCQGAASAMENGQSGSGVTILVGGPGNTATGVYAGSVYGVHLEGAGSRPRLFIDVAAIDCGQKNADRVPFSNWTFCSRPLDWNPAKRTFGFAPMSQTRPIQ